MSRPRTPEPGKHINGTARNEGASTPKTPIRSSLALTEYAANPSPQSQRLDGSGPRYDVPEDFLLPNGYPDYLRLILTSRVYDVVQETPLTQATSLSNRLDCNIMIKREDLQPVFSFKLRGAYNKMAHLKKTQYKGVVACSAGNHAQGVAYSARKLRLPAMIVMPEGTPSIKHLNVTRLGGHVVLHGADFDASKEKAHELEVSHGLTPIHPFDDPYVIAGQGTVGMEIIRQTNLQDLEAIFVCVGGGGLIAGIGVYVKRIAPHVKIYGVETYDANALYQSRQKGERVVLKEVGLFADGTAVKVLGEETYRLCTEVVDDVIQVTTDETCAAIKDVFEDTRAILEPAGALSLAGLKKWVAANPSEKSNRGLVCIASGANMNFDRLRFVAERAALGEKKEALLSVTIPEQPGAFAALVDTINPHSVSEFSYRYSSASSAHLFIGIEFMALTREHDLVKLIQVLADLGMQATDLSDDELVKSHIRYLIGGRSSVANERLFMFEFPERRGSLYKFLTTLKPGFNISLFHYRNYGGDVAKILAAIQCPQGEELELNDFLRKINYPYQDVTDNPAYRMFLRE